MNHKHRRIITLGLQIEHYFVLKVILIIIIAFMDSPHLVLFG